MCSMPRCWRARPTWLGCERSGALPACGVWTAQRAQAGAGLAPTAMPAPRPPFGEQPGALQGALDERVTERNAVVPAHEIVEMAAIEASVALAIEPQQALDLRHGHAPRRGRAAAAIPEAIVAAALIAQAPATEPTRDPAENVFGLRPGELATEGRQN